MDARYLVRLSAMAFFNLILALSPQVGPPPVDFTRDIRPLLSDRCFLCHGPGDTAEVGGFRLDLREEATEDFGGAAPIVPGDPANSDVMARLRHKRARRRMPPPESKLEMSESEIALIERWIQEGAPYAEHWSFVAPRRPQLPGDQGPADQGPSAQVDEWARDPLDAFILARLESADLKPSAEVDRAAWLRRVSYALTGLPPTLSELDHFLAAQEEGAYGKELDRLFASPRHGERMATQWLDAARYADTYGYQSDVDRTVWPWRDWVIDSFSVNQPYDEFLTWQLAGDLLPNATREQQLATAFNRLHRQTNEGGSTEEEYRVEYVADRVSTLSTAVLGLTMECAQCHDHKFDPFSHEDFYGLAGFFDDIDESGLYSHFTQSVPTPALDLPTPEQEQRALELEEAVVQAEARVAQALADSTPTTDIAGQLQGWFPFDSIDAATPEPTEDGKPGTPGPKERLRNLAQEDKHGLAHRELSLAEGFQGQALSFGGDEPATFPGVGEFHRSDPFSIGLRLWVPRNFERAVVLHRSRAWTDSGSRGYELLIEEGRASAALIHFWPGDAVRVQTKQALPLERWVQVTLTWDGSSRASGLKLYVDGQLAAVDVVRDHLQRSILGGDIKHLSLGERFRDKGFKGGRADDLFVYGRELSAAEVARVVLEPAPPSATALDAEPSELQTALEDLRAARRARDDARGGVLQVMTMSASITDRSTYLLERGSYLSPSHEVEPHTPAVLSPFPPGANKDRLGLAQWLTDPAHPLTARVEINRLWQLAFGNGLVSTPEDFGSQGTPPSHPELLDSLALDFIESGWDRQAILRRILLSATYRQVSTQSASAHEIDPDNHLLSHAPRKRLSAEMLRDGVLFSAGLLVEKIGGPPVKPYQPAGLWQEKSGKVYHPDKGEGLWRRSLYTFWKRTSPPPSMMIFDAAKRDVCIVKRAATSSPLQALVLWNDPQYVEASRKLASRSMRSGGDARQIAGQLFRRLTSRVADEEELAILLQLQQEQHSAFLAEPEQAQALISVGESALDTDLDPSELASWTVVSQVMLSFDASLSTP